MRSSRLLAATLTLTLIAVLAACGGPPPTLSLGYTLNEPAVYQVTATAESRFSGSVSDLDAETDLVAAFRATPVSKTEVEVEALRIAASIKGRGRDPVALGLEPLAGQKATVELGAGGVVSGVRGDPELLEADTPLISMGGVIASLFPPLPGEPMRQGDAWVGPIVFPFGNIEGSPTAVRFVLTGLSARNGTGKVQGYEVEEGLRSFRGESATGEVTGQGEFDVLFRGEVSAREGYTRTRTTAGFDSTFLRLGPGAEYANGNIRMDYESVVERLNPAEQLGLDT